MIFFCCLVTQLYPTLCDPMNCSPPVSPVPGISQARILQWVAIFFSFPGHFCDRTHVSCIGRQILYQWATREVTAKFMGTMKLGVLYNNCFYQMNDDWMMMTDQEDLCEKSPQTFRHRWHMFICRGHFEVTWSWQLWSWKKKQHWLAFFLGLFTQLQTEYNKSFFDDILWRFQNWMCKASSNY